MDAVSQADIIILAVPDKLIGKVSIEIAPDMKPGCMLVCLDPAAPWGGELALCEDISYFVCHPCHPPIVNNEVDPEARLDFFGAIKAKQHVVAALMQGSESDYARGEELVRLIFAPVMNVYRVTVEQMVILEPALSETVVLTCMVVITEAIEDARSSSCLSRKSCSSSSSSYGDGVARKSKISESDPGPNGSQFTYR